MKCKLHRWVLTSKEYICIVELGWDAHLTALGHFFHLYLYHKQTYNILSLKTSYFWSFVSTLMISIVNVAVRCWTQSHSVGLYICLLIKILWLSGTGGVIYFLQCLQTTSYGPSGQMINGSGWVFCECAWITWTFMRQLNGECSLNTC